MTPTADYGMPVDPRRIDAERFAIELARVGIPRTYWPECLVFAEELTAHQLHDDRWHADCPICRAMSANGSRA